MQQEKPRLAFLGIGLMGEPQAANLLRAGYRLSAWNRTPGKAEALRADGARIAHNLAEAVSDADIVLLMLADGDVVEEVLFGRTGAAGAMSYSALVIDMSSIHPDQARSHAARLAEKGIGYLDAPVSGGTVGAREASLTIFVGGGEEDYRRGAPVLGAMGRPQHLGAVGAGQTAKLANQMIVASTIAGIAEALLFARRAGVDEARLRDALRGGFADSRILELHGRRMVERDFTPGARASTQLKDMENCRSAAARLGFNAPLLALTTDLYRDLLAHEGDVDHSGLYLALDRRSRN